MAELEKCGEEGLQCKQFNAKVRNKEGGGIDAVNSERKKGCLACEAN